MNRFLGAVAMLTLLCGFVAVGSVLWLVSPSSLLDVSRGRGSFLVWRYLVLGGGLIVILGGLVVVSKLD